MSREGVWANPVQSFEVVDSAIVQPFTSSPTEVRTSLSLSDANKVGWGQAACVWFFDPTPAGASANSEHALLLKTSLSRTLDSYRPWCGRLLMRPYTKDPLTSQIQHYGRLELVNGSDDPGVLFLTAKRAGTLHELIPNLDERRSTRIHWDVTALDGEAWYPEQMVANPMGKPDVRSNDDHCLIVKLTFFEDGAAAVAIKVSHACADAHSLVRFAKDWSAVSRAQLQGTPIPLLTPLFNAHLVDNLAGKITASTADSDLIAVAKALPVQRFDSWVSLPDQAQAEFAEDPTATVPAGDQMPLAEMGMTSPKSHYVVHFSPGQVQRLWEDASKDASSPVSRQDAILAHIWSRINAARGLDTDDGPVYCNYMLGFRSRISPSLGDSFTGSPFAVVSAQCKASDSCSSQNLSVVASSIASTTQKFNTKSIGSLIHLWAYDSSPTRIWGHMFGLRHFMATSWVRDGINDVDFGRGPPRFARPNMPSIDGMVLLVEACGKTTGLTSQGERWDRFGVDACVYVAEDVMRKFLADPLLTPP